MRSKIVAELIVDTLEYTVACGTEETRWRDTATGITT
jgi:hypothetical protein